MLEIRLGPFRILELYETVFGGGGDDVDVMLQILMRTTTGLRRGPGLISGLRGAQMMPMEWRVHLEDHSLDNPERMSP